MFLHLLDEQQQQLFFRSAHYVASLDGLDELERLALEEAQLECGFEVSDIPPVQESAPLLAELSILDHVAARNAFMLELIGVVAADEEVSADEAAVISEFAQQLDLDDQRLDELYALARRWGALAADTAIVLGEG